MVNFLRCVCHRFCCEQGPHCWKCWWRLGTQKISPELHNTCRQLCVERGMIPMARLSEPKTQSFLCHWHKQIFVQQCFATKVIGYVYIKLVQVPFPERFVTGIFPTCSVLLHYRVPGATDEGKEVIVALLFPLSDVFIFIAITTEVTYSLQSDGLVD